MRPPHIFQFIATIAMLFLNQAINANPKFINQEGPGLQISSTLMYNEERVPDYQLIIYDENQLTDTIFVAKAKPVFLKLSYGHNYSIRYIKQGFHERVVMIDTRVCTAKQNKMSDFDFEIEMIPTYKNGNTLYGLPVALINYDYTDNKFEYSRNYHRQVRGKEIKEIDIDN